MTYHVRDSRTLRVLAFGALLAFVVTAAGVRVSAQSQNGATVPRLLPGAAVDVNLAAGAIGAFGVSVEVGTFVQLIVERPAPLILRVVSPGAMMIAELHRVETRESPARISFIAESSGEHRLELRPRDATLRSGPHRVRIEEHRPAVQEDVMRVRAERAFEAGERLRGEGTAVAVRSALAAYETALAAWTSIGDRQGQADALLAIGDVHGFVSDAQLAMRSYVESLERRQPEADLSAEAQTLNTMGFFYRRGADMERSLESHVRALAAARAVNDRWMEALALNNIARTHSDTDDPTTALEHHAAAIAISQSINDRRGEAWALNNTGNIHQTLGDMEGALAAYTRALELRRSVGDRVGVSATLGNIGRIYRAKGEPQRAREFFEEALELTRLTGSRDTEGRTLFNLGTTHQMLGSDVVARELIEQALAICTEVRDRFCEAEALDNLARVEASRGRTDAARDHLTTALGIRTDLNDHAGATRTRIISAAIAAQDDKLVEAQAHLATAIDIVESQRATVASPDLRATYLATTRDAYELYVDVLMRLHATDAAAGHAEAALHMSERARARSLLDTLGESRGSIREGVDPDLLEREQNLRRQVNLAAAKLNTLLAGPHTVAQRQRLEKEIDELIARQRQLEADIRAKSPRYAALTQPSPLRLEQIQKLVVDNDSLLLEYALGEERSYVWAITPTSMESHVLPGRAVIEEAARRVHELMQQSHRPGVGAQARRAAAELSRMVLAPVSAALGTRRLLVVPDGALQFVPFAALPTPQSSRNQEPLVVRHEIVVLPSASAVATLRLEWPGRPRADRQLVVLADPVLEASDPRVRRQGSQMPHQARWSRDLLRSASDAGTTRFERLRFTRNEAKAIMGLAGQRSLMALDFEASRVTAMAPEVGRYRFVHFASHALLNTRHPELSGIVLSLVGADGTPQDGFLRLHDIYNMRLSADLVVLSACQTALGRDIRGEGLIGLTRGFMYAGAPRIVSSLWDVRDEQTSELMVRFYRGMLRNGQRPAAALRAAQISMLKEPSWSAPVYWAGFTLQGEWR